MSVWFNSNKSTRSSAKANAPMVMDYSLHLILRPILLFLIRYKSASMTNKKRIHDETPPYLRPLWVWKGVEIKSPSLIIISSSSYIEYRVLIIFAGTFNSFSISQILSLGT